MVELFKYQTVLDTRTTELTQLNSIYSTEDLNMEYIGPHDHLIPILPEFSKGQLYRSTLGPRNSYKGQKVVDMSKIRMEFARNQITDKTFYIIDYNFFNEKDESD